VAPTTRAGLCGTKHIQARWTLAWGRLRAELARRGFGEWRRPVTKCWHFADSAPHFDEPFTRLIFDQ